MSFEAFLREQMKKHPSMQPQDVVKMCYQAAFGAEHLLLDLDVAKSYLEKEYAEVVATKDELYEQISDISINPAMLLHGGICAFSRGGESSPAFDMTETVLLCPLTYMV